MCVNLCIPTRGCMYVLHCSCLMVVSRREDDTLFYTLLTPSPHSPEFNHILIFAIIYETNKALRRSVSSCAFVHIFCCCNKENCVFDFPSINDHRINNDKTAIRHFRVGSLSDRCQSDGFCYMCYGSYLRTGVHILPCYLIIQAHCFAVRWFVAVISPIWGSSRDTYSTGMSRWYRDILLNTGGIWVK